MGLYDRPNTDDEELAELEKEQEEAKKAKEEEEKEGSNWKTRYGDLRSHSAKREAELTKQIETLQEAVNELKANKKVEALPTSKEDIEKWKAKYPDLYNVVLTIAKNEAGSSKEDVEKELETLRTANVEGAKEIAKTKLETAHPDFFNDIAQQPEFHEWLEEQPKASQDAIYVNETDWQAASKVVQNYKDYVELETLRANKKDPKAGIRNVDTRGGASPSGNDVRGRIYTEAEIEAMNPAEYEALEEDIDKARTEGRIRG